jgi:hypothetical protein
VTRDVEGDDCDVRHVLVGPDGSLDPGLRNHRLLGPIL